MKYLTKTSTEQVIMKRCILTKELQVFRRTRDVVKDNWGPWMPVNHPEELAAFLAMDKEDV